LGFESLSRNHAAAHGCGSAFVPRMIRVSTGWRLHVLVLQLEERPGREPGCCGFNSRRAHAMPFGSASVSPWYGLAARVGTGERLPVTVVSAVQHASSPCSQGRFESGRSLACRTSPMAEASRSGRGGLRFESAVRYGRRNGERTDQGSGVAANDCAANAVVFESPTLLGG
jgi:hypothetical protein